MRRRRSTPVRRPRRTPTIRRHAGNPYFNKRRHAAAGSGWKQYLLFIGGPVALVFLLGYLVWGPGLKIKQVNISGASEATERSIRQIISGQLGQPKFLPADNVLLFDEQRLAGKISESYFLEELKVEKHLPGRLDIAVVEKAVRLALLADQRFLGLDDSGYLVRELTEPEVAMLGPLPPGYGQALAPELGAEEVIVADTAADESASESENKGPAGYPIITFANEPDDESSLVAGAQPIQASTAGFIIQAANKLYDYVDERPDRFVSRGSNSDTVEAVMRTGWDAYFSSAQPFERQASKLALILRDKVGERRAELEYVDLRYGERIFFKFKEPPGPSEPG